MQPEMIRLYKNMFKCHYKIVEHYFIENNSDNKKWVVVRANGGFPYYTAHFIECANE